MKEAGWALIALGVALVFGALAYETTVSSAATSSYGDYGMRAPEAVYNIGRLQMQLMIFQAGIAAMISGSIFLAANFLSRGVLLPNPGGGTTGESQPPAPEAAACQWCDRSIPAPHSPCSSVPDEKLRRQAGQVGDTRCRAILAERGFSEPA